MNRRTYRAECAACGLFLRNNSRAMFFRHMEQHSWNCDQEPVSWFYDLDAVPTLFSEQLSIEFTS